jgi:acetyl-CoA carboxylase carboxyltransferase component
MVNEKFKELERKRAEAALGGGEERIKKQHEAGKYTARECITKLLASVNITSRPYSNGVSTDTAGGIRRADEIGMFLAAD